MSITTGYHIMVLPRQAMACASTSRWGSASEALPASAPAEEFRIRSCGASTGLGSAILRGLRRCAGLLGTRWSAWGLTGVEIADGRRNSITELQDSRVFVLYSVY